MAVTLQQRFADDANIDCNSASAHQAVGIADRDLNHLARGEGCGPLL